MAKKVLFSCMELYIQLFDHLPFLKILNLLLTYTTSPYITRSFPQLAFQLMLSLKLWHPSNSIFHSLMRKIPQTPQSRVFKNAFTSFTFCHEQNIIKTIMATQTLIQRKPKIYNPPCSAPNMLKPSATHNHSEEMLQERNC